MKGELGKTDFHRAVDVLRDLPERDVAFKDEVDSIDILTEVEFGVARGIGAAADPDGGELLCDAGLYLVGCGKIGDAAEETDKERAAIFLHRLLNDEFSAFARFVAAGELELRALQKGHVVDPLQR